MSFFVWFPIQRFTGHTLPAAILFFRVDSKNIILRGNQYAQQESHNLMALHPVIEAMRKQNQERVIRNDRMKELKDKELDEFIKKLPYRVDSVTK